MVQIDRGALTETRFQRERNVVMYLTYAQHDQRQSNLCRAVAAVVAIQDDARKNGNCKYYQLTIVVLFM